MTRLELAQDVENISNVQAQRTLVNRSLQHALERVYQFFDFPYYIQDSGVISTVATYETGTVNVANGSKNLTFSGSTLTSGMAGRKIRFTNDTPFYRILSVDTVGGTAVLEQEYKGTSDTDATFIIYKDEYRLASDVDKFKLIRQAENSIILFDSAPSDLDNRYPIPNSYSDPSRVAMAGSKLDTYSTGTVTATGTTITGTSTAWTSVEGLGRLSKLRIGSNVYNVKTVDSATQITVYETVTLVTAATAYEITLNNLIVQLHDIPDADRLLYYRYFRRPAPLAQDYDIPDMPHDFHWVLMYGALSIILMQKGDVNKAQNEAEARFIDGLMMMKLKVGSFAPDRIYYRRSIDRMQPRMGGRENSSFDRRYSM